MDIKEGRKKMMGLGSESELISLSPG